VTPRSLLRRALPAARSLQWQLFLWLLLPQVVLWAAAAIFTYNLAARYANEAIDASLVQASYALARQIKPTAGGLYIDFPRSAQEILESDPTDRVIYAVSSPPGKFILGEPNLRPPPGGVPPLDEPRFYDTTFSELKRGPLEGVDTGSERVRAVALHLKLQGEGASESELLVQVARSRANREKLARRILVDTALPLSGLVLLMTVIVWSGIHAGLKPLALLQSRVQGRSAQDISPIQLDAAPPEVRSLAGAINTLLAEVHHHVAVQKRFISDAAHQLRTPLAGLKSQTELALQDAADPALRARLQRVHDSAVRSAHLVNQLLALARAEPESAARHERHPVDLQRLARQVTAELVPRALASGVDLGLDEPPEDSTAGPSVDGIALLLGEALHNLIDNAIHYAGSGASVTVRVRSQGQQAVLEVEDDGPGIPLADRERVFERFVRGATTGNGCGLGLSIVREIAALHDGQVQLLDAAAGASGTLARITLPGRRTP
jgi:two-component system, OmpR family, sensor histidine kinase TctE